jgi:hypothetical protein
MGVRVRHSSKGERNGLRRLGDPGSCRRLDRVFHSSRRRTSDGPTAGRRPRGCAWWCPRVARRRGFGRHVLQRRRLARSARWCHHAAVDPEPGCSALRPAPIAVDSVIGERHRRALGVANHPLDSELRLPLPAAWLLAAHETARWGLMPIVSRGSCTHDRVMTGFPRASPPFDVTSDARSVSGAELRRLRTRPTPGQSNASRPVRPPTTSIETIAPRCRELHEPAARPSPNYGHHDPSQS